MPSEIFIKEIPNDEYASWDNLVESSTYGTIFHKSWWLKTNSKLLNRKFKIYGFFRKKELVGGCSVYLEKSKFYKIATSTVQMTPYGGILLLKSKSQKVRKQETMLHDFIKALTKHFKKNDFDIVKITNSPSFVDIRPFIWNKWDVNVLYTYTLDLSGNIKKRISKEVRGDIKKAIKLGVKIKESYDIDKYYNLYKMTFERQNLKPRVDKKYFKEMLKLLKDKNSVEIKTAVSPNGETICSEIVIFDNHKAYRWSAASHTELRTSGAVSYLLSSILEHIKEKNSNIEQIDLMAANTPNLAYFISSFNPDLIPYYRVYQESKKYLLTNRIYSNILKTLKNGD